MKDSTDYILHKLSEILIDKKWKIVVAESCTGGGVAKAMTSLPGSSAWFDRGMVTYSNESKMELLNVSASTLELYGAVSIETANEMALGALNNSHAQVSLSVTGIAGPDGGTMDKPVGTVCFAWTALNHTVLNAMMNFTGDRIAIREQAIMMAIQGVFELMEKMEDRQNT